MEPDRIPTGPARRAGPARERRGTKAHRRGGPWRDNLEAVVVAVVVALVLKQFVVEAYRIPTGSMQPTLMGDERTGVFDRILVDKLSYRFRDPERFDVVVFRYPLERSKNFVKRIVGMPGEHLRIAVGDLWVRGGDGEEWRVLRRPRRVQEATWKHVVADPDGAWPTLGMAGWSSGGDWIRARGDGESRFRGGAPVRDAYTHGYPAGLRDLAPPPYESSGQNRVGDLRIEARVTALAGTRWVAFELTEGLRRYTFVLPGPAAPPDSAPAIAVAGADPSRAFARREERAERAWRLPAGRAVRVGAQNLDDLLELDVGGELVVAIPVPSVPSSVATVTVRQEGEGVDLHDVRVLRDIHYLPAGESEVSVPAGHYYVLGDNTQDSSDSREWTFARWAVAGPDGSTRILRGNLDRENPRYLHGGPGGTEVLLVDEWGERHRFAWRDADELAPRPAPFVARDLILGRALCVFWPIQPWRDVVRLQWVR